MFFAEAYKEYLNTLEAISQDHDELTDTDVRERLHEVINWYFIWGNPIDSSFPRLYAMFTPEGNALVAKATKAFIEKASQAALNISVGAERNALIEDVDITTDSGFTFDDFLGSAETVLPAELPASDDLYGDYDE